MSKSYMSEQQEVQIGQLWLFEHGEEVIHYLVLSKDENGYTPPAFVMLGYRAKEGDFRVIKWTGVNQTHAKIWQL